MNFTKEALFYNIFNISTYPSPYAIRKRTLEGDGCFLNLPDVLVRADEHRLLRLRGVVGDRNGLKSGMVHPPKAVVPPPWLSPGYDWLAIGPLRAPSTFQNPLLRRDVTCLTIKLLCGANGDKGSEKLRAYFRHPPPCFRPGPPWQRSDIRTTHLEYLL